MARRGVNNNTMGGSQRHREGIWAKKEHNSWIHRHARIPLPLDDHGSVGSPAMPWFLSSEKFEAWRQGRWATVHLWWDYGTMSGDNVWKEVLALRDGRVGASMGGSWSLKLTLIVILYKEPRGRERCRAVLHSGALWFRGQSGGDSELAYLTSEDSAGVIFISTRL